MEGAKLRVSPREVAEGANPWVVDLNLVSVDRGERGRLGALTACRKANQQAVFTIEDVEIQYENSNRGLKQSFLVAVRPPGPGMLNLRLDLSSEGIRVNANKVDETAVVLIDAQGREVIEYGELLVMDANGMQVPAHFEIKAGDTISIVVDDRTAPYPLLVDPLVFNKSYNESQSGAQFGFSVSGIGTTKAPTPGGGIIVGAPYYDDGTNANVGKVFAFEAPQSTLPASATWTKLGNQAGACFGFSLADAGDVDDDGYDDVIIGSPYYDYYGSSRGKAEIFAGSSSGLGSSAYWTAYGEGDGACFGWSVAGGRSVGDYDTIEDVLVGAPWTSVGEEDRMNRSEIFDVFVGAPDWDLNGQTADVGLVVLFVGQFDDDPVYEAPSIAGVQAGEHEGTSVAYAKTVEYLHPGFVTGRPGPSSPNGAGGSVSVWLYEPPE